MKNKSKKPLIFISIVVFLLITGVFYFSYTEIEKKNNKAEKTINQWQAEDLRRKEIETIIKSVQAIKDDNEVIKTHFAQSSDLVPFLDTIDGFAPKVGAENEITSVDITQDTKELIVGMKVIGSFEAVYRL